MALADDAGRRIMGISSGKIDDMKMTWPFAIVVGIALIVAGVVTIRGGDTSDILTIVSLLINAVLLAEMREVKTQTNGNTSRMFEELAMYRRQAQDITNRALSSPALPEPPQDEADPRIP